MKFCILIVKLEIIIIQDNYIYQRRISYKDTDDTFKSWCKPIFIPSFTFHCLIFIRVAGQLFYKGCCGNSLIIEIWATTFHKLPSFSIFCWMRFEQFHPRSSTSLELSNWTFSFLFWIYGKPFLGYYMPNNLHRDLSIWKNNDSMSEIFEYKI